MEQTADNAAALFIQSLNEENFDKAETFLDPDFVFEGVLGRRETSAVYIKDMEQMKFKYQVLQSFTAGEDVCYWYNINMGEKTILASGWYHIKGQKILSLKVIFDPRPLFRDQ
ncbi:nuclear transport factor 2 family protein [Chryseobacterium sp.]|uniref:nuclear transport factor 2 family protein n=1 Tax=Chryseobacterium sp. TaxID=1871047 RepID=UPI0025B7FC1C|nr:nuclear transport factor 2 family protein [Chryseobacterium sp.]MBV8327810.1 nuclear transport factor 2 family protein [Chryseobacterium sp.]